MIEREEITVRDPVETRIRPLAFTKSLLINMFLTLAIDIKLFTG